MSERYWLKDLVEETLQRADVELPDWMKTEMIGATQRNRTDEIDRLRAENERLREAIFWACGVNGTFRLREDGEGQFWWRKELRELAGISGEELNRRALAEIEEVEGE